MIVLSKYLYQVRDVHLNIKKMYQKKKTKNSLINYPDIF